MTVEHSYKTKGICASQINFKIEEGCVKEVCFVGGCDGNHTGIGRLVEGMAIDEVIERLGGIKCGARESSCPGQLAQALIELKNT